jgi:hypothetical protein
MLAAVGVGVFTVVVASWAVQGANRATDRAAICGAMAVYFWRMLGSADGACYASGLSGLFGLSWLSVWSPAWPSSRRRGHAQSGTAYAGSPSNCWSRGDGPRLAVAGIACFTSWWRLLLKPGPVLPSWRCRFRTRCALARRRTALVEAVLLAFLPCCYCRGLRTDRWQRGGLAPLARATLADVAPTVGIELAGGARAPSRVCYPSTRERRGGPAGRWIHGLHEGRRRPASSRQMVWRRRHGGLGRDSFSSAAPDRLAARALVRSCWFLGA